MDSKVLPIMLISLSTFLINVTGKLNLNIIERPDWGARRMQKSNSEYLETPKYVVLRDSQLEMCFFPAECREAMRLAQHLHMTTGNFDDIIDNFRIGGDGNVYVGRGWGTKPPPAFNYNDSTIIIGFMGNLDNYWPTNAQLRSAQLLLELGTEERKISSDYKLLGAPQIFKDLLPLGRNMVNLIKIWPHWSPQP